MKERLVTLGLAACALALFYVLFMPKPAPPSNTPAMPLSTETGPYGYQAVWRWLNAERIPVHTLRDRYDRLSRADTVFKSTGNILLTTLPQKLPERPLEAMELDRWVERGNTLIVMAALDDTPLWTLGYHRLVEAVGRMTRLKFEVVEEQPPRVPQRSLGTVLNGLLQSQQSSIEPRGVHPLLEGVHSVRVVSELPASRWRASPMDRSAVLEIGQIAGSGDPAIWLRRQGKGQVITFAVASIFSNQLIGEQDNGRLLSNLVAWSRGLDGAVIFDDAHQGSVNYYDAKAFFADPRLRRTIGWILVLWLVFVLGVQPLRSGMREWNPLDITAFIAMSGEFFASTLTPAAMGARLFENFFDSVRRRLDLRQDGNSVWEWLSAQAGVSLRELAELRRLHQRIRAGRRVNLVRLQNLLSHVQGNLI